MSKAVVDDVTKVLERDRDNELANKRAEGMAEGSRAKGPDSVWRLTLCRALVGASLLAKSVAVQREWWLACVFRERARSDRGAWFGSGFCGCRSHVVVS